MKKALTILLAALLLTAVSCGSQEESSAPAETPAPEETAAPSAAAPAVSDDGCLCELDNGLSVKLGMKMDDIRGSIGTVTETLEAPSCLYDGVDTIYTIDGAYTLTTTVAADGAERITELSFLSDAAALNVNGIFLMIGSAETDLTAAFGEPASSDFGVLRFSVEGGSVTAAVADGSITALTVSYSGN